MSEGGGGVVGVQKRFVSGLVIDRELAPRATEPYHVKELAEALRAGAELPPIVVERATSRVVDGFHRVAAHHQVFGREALIGAVEKDYRSDADLFLDAAHANSSHGRRLSRFEQIRCLEIADRLSVEPARIARALSIRQATLEDLRASRFAEEASTRELVPLKRTILHMRGKKLTRKQIEANRKLGGQAQSFYANQLILLIEADLLDTDDGSLLETIRRLKELLDSVGGIEPPAQVG